MLRFLAVGVLNTGVGLSVIYLGMYVLGLGDAAANVAGYAIGIALSFVLNKYWTFSSAGRGAAQFVRFIIVTGCAYGINLAVVLVLIHLFHANRYLAQACGIAPYTIVGYLGSRYFVFRAPAARSK
jgi:putative flippase GtrA